MEQNFDRIREIYSAGDRFDEMQVYTNRKLKIWEEEVVASFPAQCHILDVGCGKGREAFCLSEKGFQVTGIDISQEVIATADDLAKANGLHIRFMVSESSSFPFPDASFDVVVIWSQTFGLFYSEKEQQRFLAECRRVLKPGGILSFSGHDGELLRENYAEFIMDDGHFHPFENSDLHYTIFTGKELAECAKRPDFG